MSADFWAGYLSGAAGILIGNPLDIVKVRLQAGSSVPSSATAASPVWSSSSSAARRRLAALATGTAAPLLGYGALNALLFVSYRRAEEQLCGLVGGPSSSTPTSAPSPTLAVTWLAGAVAGLATWVVSTPTELVKCRAQMAPPSAAAHSSWAVARQVWAAEGLRGFFLGGTVTVLRDSIGYGFYFWAYQLATDAWRRQWPGSDGHGNVAAANSQAATLLCGGVAGIVTWVSVFPLDVVKTRVQAQALRGVVAAATSSTLTTPATPLLASAPRLSTLAVTRQAYREGGLPVFFRGLGVCSARAFVVNAVQWAVYEWIMRELGAQPGPRDEGVAL